MVRQKRVRKLGQIISGFSKLTQDQRKQYLVQHKFVSEIDLDIFQNNVAINDKLNEQLIENLIGSFPFPLGIAVNFYIDGEEYIIPMVVEETSVIAAASKNAKWIRETGEIRTYSLKKYAIGQVQIPKVQDVEHFTRMIGENKIALLHDINNNIAKRMVARGGGAKDIIVRHLKRPDGSLMTVLHVIVDTCDAMGANLVNQICEYLKDPIERLTGEEVGMCILSNYADQNITRAEVFLYNVEPKLSAAIEEASLFAELDPYRAVTHNKGIMNAIDGVLLATGNDWRAVEAGVHAYASRTGSYKPISTWKVEANCLHGIFEAPLAVGTVGGITNIHPHAKFCLKLLNYPKAEQLAKIIAAVGLVQNLAALRALVTKGITAGHMKLHAVNLALDSGATPDELPHLEAELLARLSKQKYITGKDAQQILASFRKLKRAA